MLPRKRLLVIYFSQTGQVEQAVRATLAPLESVAQLHYASLRPVQPYPFPWSYRQFLEAFPDAVLGITHPVHPLNIDEATHFDLVVIAYQPWFLSISTPVLSFLESAQGQALLKGRPVVTLLACRNMWLTSQARMQSVLARAGARLVGQIAFADRAPNLVSLVTVLAYLLKGVSGRLLGIFPPYGISRTDLAQLAPRIGRCLGDHLASGQWETLQAELATAGAVQVHPQLMLLESRASRMFRLYARFIAGRPAGSAARLRRLRLFGVLLPIGVVLLSPLAALAAHVLRLVRRRHVDAEVRRHMGLPPPSPVPNTPEHAQ